MHPENKILLREYYKKPLEKDIAAAAVVGGSGFLLPASI
jgi:hypothetical protein